MEEKNFCNGTRRQTFCNENLLGKRSNTILRILLPGLHFFAKDISAKATILGANILDLIIASPSLGGEARNLTSMRAHLKIS